MKAQHQQQIVPHACPMCDAPQKHLSSVPLVQQRVRSIVHITCAKCGGNILAFASQGDMGMMTVGMVTDLSVAEAQMYMNAGAIHYDDVLALHGRASRKMLTLRDLTL